MNAIARILENSRPKTAAKPIVQTQVETNLANLIPQVVHFSPPVQPVRTETPKALLEVVSNFRHQVRVQKNGIIDLEETRLFYRGTYLYGRQSVIGKGGVAVDMIVDIPADVAVGESVCGFARTANSSSGRVLDKIEGRIHLDSSGRKVFLGHIFVDGATMSASGCTIKKYALHMLLRPSTATGTKWLQKRGGLPTVAESTWQLARC